MEHYARPHWAQPSDALMPETPVFRHNSSPGRPVPRTYEHYGARMSSPVLRSPCASASTAGDTLMYVGGRKTDIVPA
jgi:hypothetical protein